VCDGETPEPAGEPSPKFQLYEAMPATALDPEPSKFTLRFVGDAVKLATTPGRRMGLENPVSDTLLASVDGKPSCELMVPLRIPNRPQPLAPGTSNVLSTRVADPSVLS
jgi:hypothetical protein